MFRLCVPSVGIKGAHADRGGVGEALEIGTRQSKEVKVLHYQCRERKEKI